MAEQVKPEGDQGQSGLGWRAALPDEFKEHDLVKNFQKPGDFVKSAIEIKTERDALSKKLEGAIPKLTEDSTQEERDIFYQSLGRPEKADGYEFEGEALDPKTAQWAKDTFFKAGLNKEQAKAIQTQWDSFMGEMVKAEVESRKAAVAETEAKLKTEWGDKYDLRVERIRRFWKKHSGEEIDNFVNESKIGNDPRLLSLLDKLAEVTGEDLSPPSSPRATVNRGFNATEFYATIAKKP